MSFFTNKFRNRFKIELKSKYCIDSILQPLTSHVILKINGSLTSEDIIRTVVSLAVDKSSVHSVSKQYSAVACETSLRYHLKKLNMDELILSNEKILLQNPLKTLKTGKSYEFAIDLTNDPYYGKTDSSKEKYVIRSQAKKSTNSFYSYISLYITNKNERFTVSVLPVEKKKPMVEYLSYFLYLIKRLNFKIKVLCLDREFYSIDVFEFLQSNGVPHIVPVVKKGEKMKQLMNGNKARSTQYVMKNSKKKILLDIIIDVKYLKGKRGKKGCENLGFVVFGVKWSPRKVSTVYRRRFAIESSYRMRNVVRPKTSSKNATIRYFYALVSFLLKNIWLYIQKKHFTIVKRGPQVIDEDKFRFEVFILIIKEWIRRKLRVRTTVWCLR
ncbi:ISH3 family transposase [Methanosarcina sp. DH2]|uniref:ISH3 family transposase n=1 Tax=Methanosarcina sp. DH2 TaxID=2605639 RepID=UPI001E2A6746|nr:ISH3 family transposase [Methanosarcina sp. DH2]